VSSGTGGDQCGEGYTAGRVRWLGGERGPAGWCVPVVRGTETSCSADPPPLVHAGRQHPADEVAGLLTWPGPTGNIGCHAPAMSPA
jgi:hypothetical protein